MVVLLRVRKQLASAVCTVDIPSLGKKLIGRLHLIALRFMKLVAFTLFAVHWTFHGHRLVLMLAPLTAVAIVLSVCVST